VGSPKSLTFLATRSFKNNHITTTYRKRPNLSPL
jgi:hypothetical protein